MWEYILEAGLAVAAVVLGAKWGKGTGIVKGYIEKISDINIQVKEALSTIQNALEDNKITKEEAIDVAKECKDVLTAVKALTNK